MSIKIKKINKLTSFCGLNDVCSDSEFQDYNVIFANNGAGKTSTTRAFELLIGDNCKHINRYQTIDSPNEPDVSFTLNNNSCVNLNSTQINIGLPFSMEIYNSDFLMNNTPLNSQFGLKKLDDKTIVLEGSFVGQEAKEVQELNLAKELNINKKVYYWGCNIFRY